MRMHSSLDQTDRTGRLERIWSQVDLGTEVAAHERDIVFPVLREAAFKSRRILEVGAGDGRMIRLLRSEGVRAEFFAVDLSMRVMQAPAGAYIADARSLPFFNDSFDLVYSLAVVEHFPETAQAVKEHARVARRGGTVLITTPHNSPESLLRWLLHLKSGDYHKGTFEEVRGRNLSLRYAHQVCRDAGLVVDLCVGTGRALSWPPWASSLLRYCLPSSIFGSFLLVRSTKK